MNGNVKSMSTTTTTTTRDRADRYGPIEWAQKCTIQFHHYLLLVATIVRYSNVRIFRRPNECSNTVLRTNRTSPVGYRSVHVGGNGKSVCRIIECMIMTLHGLRASYNIPSLATEPALALVVVWIVDSMYRIGQRCDAIWIKIVPK